MHEFVTTEDGSLTLRVPELDEHYHSVHGAIQEARHIFLRAGIDHYRGRLQQNHAEPLPLHILEAGFGTGLNAYLTLLHAEEIQVPVCYHSLEKYPLPPEETARLNYPALLGRPQDPLFRALHDAPWEETVEVTPRFLLHKHFCDFREIDFPPRFDIIFFDAFNPTYCVKGIVKRALRSVGFTLERLPGPPGKREMLRATKKCQETNAPE